jgi:hypothetical protein
MTNRAILEDDTIETRRSVGQPSSYNAKTYPQQAKFLASRGATQEELAECFGVSTRTFKYWLVRHPELYAAVQGGNDVFNPRVERALAERAIGYWIDEEEEVVINGKVARVIRRKKFIPPDVTAGIYWTKNRMKDRWSDVNKPLGWLLRQGRL